jgi:hypothetical protein
VRPSTVIGKFSPKHFLISGYQLAPKNQLSLFKKTSWDVFYELQNKENQIGNFESLVQNRLNSLFIR